MMLLLVAALMIIGPLAGVLFLIAAPLFVGVFAVTAAQTEDTPAETAAAVEPLRPVAPVKHRATA